ncbi:MAG: hypothetical protein QFC78_04045 [Pseudomonadota bacterium]|nr:hypothetical protein [Pseudomonadota bacterium]
MKKYAIAMLGLATAATATVAYARMHNSSERDTMIALCKTAVETNNVKLIAPGLHDSGASDEDVDYGLDMCFSYNSGVIAGLQMAKDAK